MSVSNRADENERAVQMTKRSSSKSTSSTSSKTWIVMSVPAGPNNAQTTYFAYNTFNYRSRAATSCDDARFMCRDLNAGIDPSDAK